MVLIFTLLGNFKIMPGKILAYINKMTLKLKNSLNKDAIVSIINNIYIKIKKITYFLLPYLTYNIKKNIFKITFIISVIFIINYCMN